MNGISICQMLAMYLLRFSVCK